MITLLRLLRISAGLFRLIMPCLWRMIWIANHTKSQRMSAFTCWGWKIKMCFECQFFFFFWKFHESLIGTATVFILLCRLNICGATSWTYWRSHQWRNSPWWRSPGNNTAITTCLLPSVTSRMIQPSWRRNTGVFFQRVSLCLKLFTFYTHGPFNSYINQMTATKWAWTCSNSNAHCNSKV